MTAAGQRTPVIQVRTDKLPKLTADEVQAVAELRSALRAHVEARRVRRDTRTLYQEELAKRAETAALKRLLAARQALDDVLLEDEDGGS